MQHVSKTDLLEALAQTCALAHECRDEPVTVRHLEQRVLALADELRALQGTLFDHERNRAALDGLRREHDRLADLGWSPAVAAAMDAILEREDRTRADVANGTDVPLGVSA